MHAGVRMYSIALMPFLLHSLKDNPAFGDNAALSLWLASIANPMLEVCSCGHRRCSSQLTVECRPSSLSTTRTR